MAGEIARDFGPKLFEKFRGRKISRPKSREIALKSVPPDVVQPRNDLQESPNTFVSDHMAMRERLRTIGTKTF